MSTGFASLLLVHATSQLLHQTKFDFFLLHYPNNPPIIIESIMNVLDNNSLNANFTRASQVKIPEIYNRRFKSGKEDLDTIFGGGGFLPGFTFTLAAGPGTGKSTFTLQMLDLLEQSGKKTAFISGEEGIEQVAFAAKRLGVDHVPIANITDIDDICDAIVEHKFDFVVLDSLPAITSRKDLNKRELEEYVVTKLITTAKRNETCIGVILHFTKTGTYKGGTLCPHSVDCNIIMTRNEEDYNLRNIDVTKNRFGTAAASVFEITARGFTFEAMEELAPGQKQQEKKTSKRDLVIQSIDEGATTVATIAQKSTVNGTYLQTILRELCAEGVIEKQGRGADTQYAKVQSNDV